MTTEKCAFVEWFLNWTLNLFLKSKLWVVVVWRGQPWRWVGGTCWVWLTEAVITAVTLTSSSLPHFLFRPGSLHSLSRSLMSLDALFSVICRLIRGRCGCRCCGECCVCVNPPPDVWLRLFPPNYRLSRTRISTPDNFLLLSGFCSQHFYRTNISVFEFGDDQIWLYFLYNVLFELETNF